MSVLAVGCQFTTKRREHNIERMNDVVKKWNSLRGIQAMHGKASKAGGDVKDNYDQIEGILQAHVDGRHKFHPDFILTDKVWDRLIAELNIYDKRILNKGFVNPLENLMGVPHYVVKRSPLAFRAYSGVDRQTSYERTNLGYINNFVSEVSQNLLDVFKNSVDRGDFGNEGVHILKKIQNTEERILRTNSRADRAAYEMQIRRLLELDKDKNQTSDEISPGRIFKDFREAIEMPRKKWDKKKSEYDSDLVLAVDKSKAYFNKMGSVLINGLEAFEKSYLLRKHGTENKKDISIVSDRATQNFISGIEAAKKSIDIKRQDGSYLPHYVIKDLPILREQMEIMHSNQAKSEKFRNASISSTSILNNIGLSTRARGRNDQLNHSWHNDPIMIGQMYGFDVIGFNKQNHLQNIVTEFIRGMGKAKTDKVGAEFVDGLGRYMDDIFTMAKKGYSDRPEWVNGMVSTLGKATVLRTMGLGFTGSVRNIASASTFYAHFGHKVISHAGDVYKTQTSKGELGYITRQAEKENGFLFMEGNPDLANELITQGMLPKSGLKEKQVRFDHTTGNVEFKESNGLWRVLKRNIDWTIENSLIFHRYTENKARQWMFRTAFISNYAQQSAQLEYAKQPGHQKKIYRDSINFAINAVNSWAYEYAGHAKSKMIRGVPGTLDENGNLNNLGKVTIGAMSQSMNMLMHYPHSLIATHIRIIRNAGVSLRVGDFTSPEVQWLYRYAGIYGAIQLASVIGNTDLNNIAENDTIEKMKEAHKSIYHFDDADKKTRGVIGQFFGPLADDVRYALEMTGLKDADRSDMAKILMGNIDYAKQTGDDASASFWYKVGTFPGLIATKVGPAIADGKGVDVIRHLFSLYPSETTRDLHEEYVEPVLGPIFGDAPEMDIDKELQATAEAAKKKGYGKRYSNIRT